MKVYISQSNYIPWRGYFDAIRKADLMLVYDCVQFTKNDWRNRNLIKTPNGVQWLTIPCRIAALHQLINDTEVVGPYWAEKHWKSICQNYSQAPFFELHKDSIAKLYNRAKDLSKISEINLLFLQEILNLLSIDTRLEVVPSVDLEIDPSRRLVQLCQSVNCHTYLTGPSARNYLNVALFEAAAIKVEWLDYDNYPNYQQLYGDFVSTVSVLDLLFNCGVRSKDYLEKL